VEQTSESTHQQKANQIKSPMVGTFYRASSPEAPSFVDINADVEVGQIVCIIEAMKLMNEIKSEVKGKIVEILIENGRPVEFGQPLFIIEPR
jgi:acetyl-CoA carboxylase biotin carboxyl carrier protein